MTHIIFSEVGSFDDGNAAVSRRHDFDFLYFPIFSFSLKKNPFHLATRFLFSLTFL